MGSRPVEERLKEAVREGTLSHAYIFQGPDENSSLALARELAKAVLCMEFSPEGPGTGACGNCVNCRRVDHDNHEDVFYVRAEGLSVKDEDIEELQAKLKLKPGQGLWKVAVLCDADTMTHRAQNRLLKTLEEPVGSALLILLSVNAENLLPTIRSRCVLQRVDSEERELWDGAAETARAVGALLLENSPFYLLDQALEPVGGQRDRAADFLDALELWYRDLLLAFHDRKGELLCSGADPREILRQAKQCRRMDIPQAVKAIEEARRLLSRHVNTAYVLKGLLLKL
ncbi:MAG: hypothetical protein Q4C22_03740 [Bacillota bacterium]|nr:hypothetical protein [Bacillota bacterium]